MITYEIRGTQYRAGKLNALKQFAIAKRLLPLVTAIGPEAMRAASAEIVKRRAERAAIDAAGEGNGSEMAQPPAFDFTPILGPLSDAVAAIADDDAEFIFRECAKVTQRRSGESWMALWNSAAGDFQFDDLNMLDLIQIAANVMMEHISDFSPGPLALDKALSPAG